MSQLLDDIHALLPDNTSGDISAKDVRDCMALVVNSMHHAVVVADNFEVDDISGDHFILLHNNVVGIDLQDGGKHVISFSVKSGSSFDPNAGVYYQTDSSEFTIISNTNGTPINKPQMDSMIQHTTFVEVQFFPDLGGPATSPPPANKGELHIPRLVHK